MRTSFFFSSRRRHTRSKRDWSSDVCSSDLPRDIESRRSRGHQLDGATSQSHWHRPKRILPDPIERRIETRKNHVPFRSEEHTSELQSRFDLVCRLLLEKKNKKNINKI